MALFPKFLAGNADFYISNFWFFLLSLFLFWSMGYAGKWLPTYILFYGNQKRAAAYEAQISGLQGFCRFFFWLALIVNGPLAALAVGYKGWEILSRHS